MLTRVRALPCGQLALLVCLSGIAVPLQLAFEERFTAAGAAWEVPSYMMDACFIADVYVQFRTGFMQEGPRQYTSYLRGISSTHAGGHARHGP